MATIYEERTPSPIVIQYLLGSIQFTNTNDTEPQTPTPTTGQIHPRY